MTLPIHDEESAREWLEGHDSREEVVGFAARSAMRALPAIGAEDNATLGAIALPVLRAILTSAVAAKIPTPEVRSAALSAYSAADSAASAALSADSAALSAALSADSAALSADSATLSADSAALSAARSADSAADSALSAALSNRSVRSVRAAAADSAYSAADVDAKRVEELSIEFLFDAPLWPEGGLPEFFADDFARLRDFWRVEPDTWGFWERWYDGMLNGAPMPWGLQKAVALIPDDIWEDGAEAVAERIREMEGRVR